MTPHHFIATAVVTLTSEFMFLVLLPRSGPRAGWAIKIVTLTCLVISVLSTAVFVYFAVVLLFTPGNTGDPSKILVPGN